MPKIKVLKVKTNVFTDILWIATVAILFVYLLRSEILPLVAALIALFAGAGVNLGLTMIVARIAEMQYRRKLLP